MRTRILVMLCAAATLSACSKNPTQPSAQGLPGTWRATRAEYVSRANSSLREEIVSRGTAMTLTLNSNGTYTMRIVDPGQAGNTIDGTWSASRDVLTLKQTGITGESQFDMNQSGNSLTLAGGSVLYDFGSDGSFEESVLNASFTRQ